MLAVFFLNNTHFDLDYTAIVPSIIV